MILSRSKFNCTLRRYHAVYGAGSLGTRPKAATTIRNPPVYHSIYANHRLELTTTLGELPGFEATGCWGGEKQVILGTASVGVDWRVVGEFNRYIDGELSGVLANSWLGSGSSQHSNSSM